MNDAGDKQRRFRRLRRAAQSATRTALLSLMLIGFIVGGGGLLTSGIIAYVGVLTQSDEDRERHAQNRERDRERAKSVAAYEPKVKLPSLPPAIFFELCFLGLGCCCWVLSAAYDCLERRKRRQSATCLTMSAQSRLPATFDGQATLSGMSRWLSVLGLDPGASWDDIRRTYRRLVLEFHPDHNKNPEMVAHFLEVTQAYSRLRAYRQELEQTCASKRGCGESPRPHP
jgi:hypothetical protein